MLYFMNDSEFDIDAMLTFGISAKIDRNSIGFFGTGFKYAVSIILRNGGSISIKSGDNNYVFGVKQIEKRGKKFNIVTINGDTAGFTDHLGINWEPWKAFRELWANCMDENGEVSRTIRDCNTVISVDCAAIDKAYSCMDEFIMTSNPIFSDGRIEIHKKPRPYYFYRGIAVLEAPEKALFSYNILNNVDLTEDRTARYNHEIKWPIAKSVQRMEDSNMLRTILTASCGILEEKISYDLDWETSEVFLSVCRECVSSGIHISDSAIEVLKKSDEKSGNWKEINLTKVQRIMLSSACEFLDGIGVDISMFPIKVVSGLGDGVMGRALDKITYISDLPFNLGTKQVASTLLEEWVHNKYGCEDFDRNMQTWLFDKILSIGEEINDKPL